MMLKGSLLGMTGYPPTTNSELHLPHGRDYLLPIKYTHIYLILQHNLLPASYSLFNPELLCKTEDLSGSPCNLGCLSYIKVSQMLF